MHVPSGIKKQFDKTRVTRDKGLICHAPTVSMNFEQNGNATACCYNRTHVLGQYPNKTLKEIWWGAKADELREYIADNNLGGGCEVCHKQLESKNFYGAHARHFDQFAEESGNRSPNFFQKLLGAKEEEREVQYPKLLEFELSNTCNLECVMCNGYFSSSIRKNREGLPPIENPYDAEFVRQLEEFIPHMTDAKFLGGEPFLIDIYYDIWERIRDINPEILVHITTNATILNNRAKALLEKMRCGIILSIDSIKKDTYERIRKNAKFERVQENIDYFLEYTKRRNTWMSFAVCPLTLNWQELPEMVDHCNEKGLSIYFNTVFKPEEYSLRFLPARILGTIIDYYKSIEFNKKSEHSEHNITSFTDLIKQLENWHTDKKNQEVTHQKLLDTVTKFLDGKDINNGVFSLKEDNLTDEIFRKLVEFVEFKNEQGGLEDKATAQDIDVEYINYLISYKEKLVLYLNDTCKKVGHEKFLHHYMDALLKLHTMLLGTAQDAKMEEKIKGFMDTVLSHSRKETIIIEILSHDPLFALTILREFSLDSIAHQIKHSY